MAVADPSSTATSSIVMNAESPDTSAVASPEAEDRKMGTAGETSNANYKKLKFLLDQSSLYSRIIGDKMDRERADRQNKATKAEKAKAKEAEAPAPAAVEAEPAKRTTRGKAAAAAATTPPSRKSTRGTLVNKRKAAETLGDVLDEEDLRTSPRRASKRAKTSAPPATDPVEHRQPALVTGATLRDYQIAGVEWLITLYENGLNGILADEMGLGKTLQTIAFLAHLRSKEVHGPFLVVCPLSTLANWVNEFERFTPDVPVLLYHGTPQERADLRTERLGMPSMTRGRASAPSMVGIDKTDKDFPVVVTTYELIMKDRNHLNRIPWKYIIVDESHRLKNMDCKLITELKTYTSANRLLLTGTPLHNNLAELWSLLNFILPDIFDNLDAFQQWFDISEVDQKPGEARGPAGLTEDQMSHILTNLHAILKPFLLRRMKVDVEKDLPAKKEYLLSAPLTAQQKELYDAVVNRQLRTFLIDQKTSRSGVNDPLSRTATPFSDDASETESVASRSRKAKKGRKAYAETTDAKFFRDWEEGEGGEVESDEAAPEEVGRAHVQRTAERSINNMRLQNMAMQLRKVCNHPWLFDWPVDEQTGAHVINDDLINASGKMLLLNRLLTALFDRGHKVLVFSQFTSQLDLIQDWAEGFKEWKICRIDGTTKQEDRRQQMKDFNEDQSADAPRMFLLSTRSGGVGINLVAADTVILFDSDWNPQMDLQAQDRAHRIGQTKPVLVFRFVAANTVESSILKRAGAKRKLEALVIGEGNFKMSGEGVADIFTGRRRKEQNMSELAEVLLHEESGEKAIIGKDDELLTDEQLETLLDRSDAAMGRTEGWTADKHATTSFEVYTTQAGGGEANDSLANLMEEDSTEA